MTIIDQLEQTVSTAVLGDDDNVAHISLLEQFYAILIMRLAQPAVYSQLLRADQSTLVPSASVNTLFEQLWRPLNQRQLLIDELAVTHHVDTVMTEQLLINAAHLAYQELKNLANGQFLPAFLQSQQSAIRPYLPVWSPAAISLLAEISESSDLGSETLIDDGNVAQAMTENSLTAEPVYVEDVYATDADSAPISSTSIQDRQEPALGTIDAIHANPSDYHMQDGHPSDTQVVVRERNRRNDLLIRLLLLAGALIALGLLWAFVIKPNYLTTTEPVAVAPVVTAPVNVVPEPIATPIELVVGVDDGGNLYSCSATVGDVGLQTALKQALNVSFGEQASNCELAVDAESATTLGTINIQTLPDMLTLLRAVPFARLQLQNDILKIEAPDEILLQRLLADMRTLAPALSITAVPPPLLNNNTLTANITDQTNGLNNEFSNENTSMNNLDNNPNYDLNNNQNYQAPDDDTNDRVVPAPPRGNIANNNTNAVPAGPISPSEVDDLANNTIVDERLRNERPVDRNLTQNQ